MPLDAPTVAGIAEPGNGSTSFTLIDPQKRVRAGTWKLDHGVLTSSHDNGERIQIPYIPPEEYDYRITFARNEGGNGVVQFASRGDREIIWWIGRDNKHFALNDKTIAQAFSGLENGEKHTSLIKVRHGSVQFFLDDRRISSRRTMSIGSSRTVCGTGSMIRDSSVLVRFFRPRRFTASKSGKCPGMERSCNRSARGSGFVRPKAKLRRDVALAPRREVAGPEGGNCDGPSLVY